MTDALKDLLFWILLFAVLAVVIRWFQKKKRNKD